MFDHNTPRLSTNSLANDVRSRRPTWLFENCEMANKLYRREREAGIEKVKEREREIEREKARVSVHRGEKETESAFKELSISE